MSILIVADRTGDAEVCSYGVDLKVLLANRQEPFAAVEFCDRGLELAFLADEMEAAQVLQHALREGHAEAFRAPLAVLLALAQLGLGLH